MPIPPSELWSKFQSAVIFARGALSAAVAVVQRTPATQVELLLLTAADAPTAAPTLATHGASIEGFRTVNLYAFASGTYAATVTLWFYTGARWIIAASIDLTDATGALDPFDVEGYQRLHCQVTAATGAPFNVGIFPYNVEV